jgi:hypothetical protein
MRVTPEGAVAATRRGPHRDPADAPCCPPAPAAADGDLCAEVPRPTWIANSVSTGAIRSANRPAFCAQARAGQRSDGGAPLYCRRIVRRKRPSERTLTASVVVPGAGQATGPPPSMDHFTVLTEALPTETGTERSTYFLCTVLILQVLISLKTRSARPLFGASGHEYSWRASALGANPQKPNPKAPRQMPEFRAREAPDQSPAAEGRVAALMCFPSLRPKHGVTAFTLERAIPGTDPNQTPTFASASPGRKQARQLGFSAPEFGSAGRPANACGEHPTAAERARTRKSVAAAWRVRCTTIILPPGSSPADWT